MPQSFFLGSYKEKAYFQAVAGAEKAPDVKFDFDKKESK
jgi:LemA protein